MIARALLSGILALSIAACATVPTPITGTVVLDVQWVDAGSGPRSIGGYGQFARIRTAGGDAVWADEINGFDRAEAPPPNQIVELEAGDYTVDIDIVIASDAVEIDRLGKAHRQFGP